MRLKSQFQRSALCNQFVFTLNCVFLTFACVRLALKSIVARMCLCASQAHAEHSCMHHYFEMMSLKFIVWHKKTHTHTHQHSTLFAMEHLFWSCCLLLSHVFFWLDCAVFAMVCCLLNYGQWWWRCVYEC